MKWYISIPLIIAAMILVRGLASMDAETSNERQGLGYAGAPPYLECHPPECIRVYPQSPPDRAHPIPTSSYDPKMLANAGGKPNHLPPHILPARALEGGR